MKREDFEEMIRIYEQGIKTGISTFQTKAPTFEQWDEGHIKECRLVVRDENKILGWASLSKIFQREVYNGLLELSIYIDKDVRGKGIGQVLLNSLIKESENHDIWSIQSLIIKENKASIALHEKCGFRQVGYWQKAGKMTHNNVWYDVVIMERRSDIIGI
jgi:phosphinothricin acetyltransferase